MVKPIGGAPSSTQLNQNVETADPKEKAPITRVFVDEVDYVWNYPLDTVKVEKVSDDVFEVSSGTGASTQKFRFRGTQEGSGPVTPTEWVPAATPDFAWKPPHEPE